MTMLRLPWTWKGAYERMKKRWKRARIRHQSHREHKGRRALRR